MYYEKVGLVYGQASGRQISPDYPSAGLDIQPKIDEYRIVGPYRWRSSHYLILLQVMEQPQLLI
jgi:hypothetical protein